MAKKRNVFPCQEQIHVGVRFGKDVVVFVRDGAMNELGIGCYFKGPDW